MIRETGHQAEGAVAVLRCEVISVKRYWLATAAIAFLGLWPWQALAQGSARSAGAPFMGPMGAPEPPANLGTSSPGAGATESPSAAGGIATPFMGVLGAPSTAPGAPGVAGLESPASPANVGYQGLSPVASALVTGGLSPTGVGAGSAGVGQTGTGLLWGSGGTGLSVGGTLGGWLPAAGSALPAAPAAGWAPTPFGTFALGSATGSATGAAELMAPDAAWITAPVPAPATPPGGAWWTPTPVDLSPGGPGGLSQPSALGGMAAIPTWTPLPGSQPAGTTAVAGGWAEPSPWVGLTAPQTGPLGGVFGQPAPSGASGGATDITWHTAPALVPGATSGQLAAPDALTPNPWAPTTPATPLPAPSPGAAGAVGGPVWIGPGSQPDPWVSLQPQPISSALSFTPLGSGLEPSGATTTGSSWAPGPLGGVGEAGAATTQSAASAGQPTVTTVGGTMELEPPAPPGGTSPWVTLGQ